MDNSLDLESTWARGCKSLHARSSMTANTTWTPAPQMLGNQSKVLMGTFDEIEK